MSTRRVKIAPSLLASDFSRLGDEISRCEISGADYIHFDVMDGCFVPNITFGPSLVRSCRPRTGLPLDVHLMVDRPDRFVVAFADAGADIITIHVESLCDTLETLKRIRALGKRAGITLRPGTEIEKIEPFLGEVDLALVMSVEPGFGGQKFLPEALEHIRRLVAARERGGFAYEIEVDGGIDALTGRAAVEAGADVIVAGTYLFRENGVGMSGKIEELRRV